MPATRTGRVALGDVDVPEVEVLAELGRGAQGTVFRVRRGTGDYALKVLDVGPDDRDEALISFRREAALLAAVDHPGLAAIHEIGRTADRPYLIMDLVDGDSLAQRLVTGPLADDRVLSLATDLAGILVAVHRAGLVHRDITPGNIIIAPQGRVRLIDFGLVTRHSVDADDSTVGTPAYAPAEQSGALNRPVDARSDLYSLGVVLYECATGRPPFVSADPATLVRMHAVTPPVDPRSHAPGLPAGLATVILTLLAKDPDDRYVSAAALLADLHRVADSPGEDLTPTTAPPIDTRAGRLAGRGPELARLTDRWARAVTGAGGIALVRGASGIGKSRLAQQVLAVATAGGALVLHGKATRDGAIPLGPIRDAVAAHLAVLDQLSPARRDAALTRLHTAASAAPSLLADLHPRLGTTGPDPGGPADGPDRHRDQARFTLAVAAFLAELARAHRGLLLHLDDLQWLDEAGRRVLTALADELAATPLLVLATARDDPDSAATLEAVTGGLGPALDTVVHLAPLRHDDIVTMLDDLLPGIRTTDQLADLLLARTRGNPFMIGEYVRAIVDAGLLRPHWGAWILDHHGLADLRLPDHALGLVLARIADLTPATRTVLATAAAIGTHVDLELITKACDLPAPAIGSALTEATARTLLEPRPGGYTFVHDRIREALLDELDQTAIANLHQRIAETLQTLPPPHPDSAADRDLALAMHHLRGVADATPIAAFRACVAGGRAALAGHAPDKAITFLDHAAGLHVFTPRHPTVGLTEAEFLQLLGTAQQRDGRYEQARATLHTALTRTDPRDRVTRASILAQIAEIHRGSWNLDDAAETADAGITELGLWAPRNRLAFALSSILLWLLGTLIGVTRIGYGGPAGPAGPRRDRHRLAVELHLTAAYAHTMNLGPASVLYHIRAMYYANRLGTSGELVLSTAALGFLQVTIGLHKVGLRRIGRAQRLLRSVDDPRIAAAVAHYHGFGSLFGYADNGESIARAIIDHGHLMDLGFFADAVACLTWMATVEGRTAEAVQWYERGRRRLAAAGDRDLTAMVPAMANYRSATGQSAAAAHELRRIEGLLPPGDTGLSMLVSGGHLYDLLEQGEVGTPMDDAIAHHRPLRLAPRLLPRPAQITFVHAALARLAQARAAEDSERPVRLAQAERAVRALRRLGKRSPVATAYLNVAGAELDLLTGRPERALARLDRIRPVEPDAPIIHYDAARTRARAYTALGAEAEVRRQASTAYQLAAESGRPHRAGWITTEFGPGGIAASQLSTHSATGTSTLPIRIERQRLHAVQEISQLAATTLDPDELAIATLDATIRILSAERAFLFLTDTDTDTDTGDAEDTMPAAGPALTAHLGRDQEGRSIRPTRYSTTLIERVRSTRETLVITGTEEGAALGAQSVVRHNLRSILVAPLQLDGRLLGVVYLDSRLAKGIFTADDAGILSALTNHIATALQTARAAHLEAHMHAARQQYHLAEALRQALATMTGTLDPRQVLTHLLDAATALLPCDRAWLVQPGTPSTVQCRPRTTDAQRPHRPGPPSTIATAPDFADRLLRAYPSPTTNPGDPATAAHHPAPVELAPLLEGAAAWLAVPLTGRTTRHGVLLLTSSRPQSYQDTELAMAATLVAQAMAAHDNATLFAQVQKLAVADELTGIANRRHFFDQAQRQLSSSARGAARCSTIMIDIDHFKRINDTYGHPTGDDVIRTVATRLAGATRRTDVLGRYGGEEFAVLLAPTDDPETLAERMRALIADEPVDTRSGPLRVTVSIGLARPGGDHDTLTGLLAAADAALYQAKQGGRNRVCSP